MTSVMDNVTGSGVFFHFGGESFPCSTTYSADMEKDSRPLRAALSASFPVIRIDIANRQKTLPIGRRLLRRAVRMVLKDGGIDAAEISLAIVDDLAMRELHCRHLGHDEPTDVLSFVLERDGTRLEGEVIVSADTARTVASRYRNSPAEELLLYVIHGTLHLVGYRDDTQRERARMSAQQRRYVARIKTTVG